MIQIWINYLLTIWLPLDWSNIGCTQTKSRTFTVPVKENSSLSQIDKNQVIQCISIGFSLDSRVVCYVGCVTLTSIRKMLSVLRKQCKIESIKHWRRVVERFIKIWWIFYFRSSWAEKKYQFLSLLLCFTNSMCHIEINK